MNLRMMDPKVKEALFGVESTHHIHGQECLCGFKSAVSRDRTKHILAVTLDAMSGQVETLVGQLDAADRQIEARSGTTAAERIWKARAEAAEAAVARARERHAKVEWRPGTPRPEHYERGVCEECWVSFPCLTILALDGTA